MLVVFAGAALAAAASHAVKPTSKLADRLGKLDLEAAVPTAFDGWTLEPQRFASIVNPQTQELLNTLYSQVLSRTYVHKDGYRIMLAVAYGGDQRDSLQVHFPEVCYAAQGFAIRDQRTEELLLGSGSIAVRRMHTSLGNSRQEPLTYWVMVGEKSVLPGIGPAKKLAEMSYTLRGVVPDGLLFRVSSIDANAERAYERQADFAGSLLAASSPDSRRRLAGV